MNDGRRASPSLLSLLLQNEGPRPGNPLGCASVSCLELLVSLTFERATAVVLLKAISGEADAAALRIGVVCRRLGRLAHCEARAGTALDQALGERLGRRAASFESRSMFDLATVWAQARDGMNGLSAAALLWTIARTQAPWFRRLEEVVVEDLTYLGARALARRSAVIQRPPSVLSRQRGFSPSTGCEKPRDGALHSAARSRSL